MNATWKLDTHGDPLGTITRFIQALWQAEKLDLFVVAPEGHDFLLSAPEQIGHANPFYPVMRANLAPLVSDTLKRHSGKRLGAILRACELRALNELVKRGLL